MRGRLTVQVAAETPEQAHTWQGRVPRRAMPGMRTVQVAANSPKTAHTRQRQTSAMSPVRYCGGTPQRAVQNQAFCRTGRPRRTVRYRKRPCGVRESFLSAGGRTQRWQQRRSSCRTDDGRKRSRWRIVMAQVRRMPMRARWLQSRCDTMPDSSGGGQMPDNEQNNDLSCLVLPTGKVLFCLIISVLSATAPEQNCVSEKCQPCCER